MKKSRNKSINQSRSSIICKKKNTIKRGYGYAEFWSGHRVCRNFPAFSRQPNQKEKQKKQQKWRDELKKIKRRSGGERDWFCLLDGPVFGEEEDSLISSIKGETGKDDHKNKMIILSFFYIINSLWYFLTSYKNPLIFFFVFLMFVTVFCFVVPIYIYIYYWNRVGKRKIGIFNQIQTCDIFFLITGTNPRSKLKIIFEIIKCL